MPFAPRAADPSPTLPDACCDAARGMPLRIGSRRRRLWELDAHAHCPVVGVCVPLPVARRLAEKTLAPAAMRALQDDYPLHCCLANECRTRTPLAEAVQKALDQRHAGAVRLAAACKTSEALADWWRARSAGAGLPGALWAVLTHPQCTPVLEHQVLGEVHMRQHQVGHEHRVDHERLGAAETALARAQDELIALRERVAVQAAELAAERRQRQAEVVRLRGQLLARDTRIAQLDDDLHALRAAAPDLPARRQLLARLQAQDERLLALQRALTQARESAARVAAEPPVVAGDEPAEAPVEPPAPSLTDRTVLCVGGRTGAVPVYREALEGLGARFEHHDGGQEENPQRLKACLAAADLVVCQAGCISHDAYWRVKDHCKRTGKRCVFVDVPSASALRRALARALAVPPGDATG